MSVRQSLSALVVCLFTVFAPAGADTPVDGAVSSHLPGLKVARCMFPQGKLVLQHGVDFHVLREGDAVPGDPGLRVLEITERHAVLIQGPKGSGPSATPAIPERLVKIEKKIDGEVTVTVLSARIPRMEGPEMQDEATVFSPWASDADAALSETPAKAAPLVVPWRLPVEGAVEDAGPTSEQKPDDGKEQR